MTTTDTQAPALPRPYLAWLWGASVSRLGDAVLGFALGWAASGLGGTTAALVITFSGLPRLVLLVIGGAVADRVGARRILIAGEAALLVLTAGLAVALARLGTSTWLLLSAALALGTVTAFCLPATGSMPRRLVADDQLTRALALWQGLGQTVLMAAAPLGGLLVGAWGLPPVAWGTVVTSGISLCVLVAVRELSGPSSARGRADGAPAPRLDLVGGFRVVLRTPGLLPALLLAGAGAALILPVSSLLVPLLGRTAGWSPGSTGAVVGAVGIGAIGAAMLMSRRRKRGTRTPHVGAGLAASAAGAFVLASGPVPDGSGGVVTAAAGALAFGFGNGTFVARVAPLVLGSTPRTHLARVQALVGLVQLVPVMATNTLLGALAEHTSPGWALAAAASGLVVCAAWARRAIART